MHIDTLSVMLIVTPCYSSLTNAIQYTLSEYFNTHSMTNFSVLLCVSLQKYDRIICFFARNLHLIVVCFPLIILPPFVSTGICICFLKCVFGFFYRMSLEKTTSVLFSQLWELIWKQPPSSSVTSRRMDLWRE